MEDLKRWIWYIIAAGVLIASAVTCTNSVVDGYIGKNNVFEKQLHRKMELLNQEKVKSEKLRDSLQGDNKKKDSIICTLKIKNVVLDQKLAAAKEKDGVLITKV